MRDLSVLNAAGAALGKPVYVFGDDAADYFNQLAMAPEEWWKLNIVFLHDDEQLRTSADTFDTAGNTLFFVSERRLGFGTHPASNIAQRFSDALLSLFRERMDAADAAHLAANHRPAYLAWREARSRIRLADEPRAHLAQQRLYFAHMYTDDPIIGVVGVQRALRALREWRSLTNDVNLLMAIPEKRTLGVWARWLGALLFAGLGVVVIPKAKLLRATALMRAALSGGLDFAAYRSLLGMLEHFQCVNCRPPFELQSLETPHKRLASRVDLAAPVLLDDDAAHQLRAQLALAAMHGGAPFTVAVPAMRVAPSAHPYIVAAFAEAATDSVPPGLGGYCQGLFWYIELEFAHVEWLHITALELLATGFNVICFAKVLSPAQRTILLSDALATPHVFSRKQARSPALRHILSSLLGEPQYQRVLIRRDRSHKR